MKTTEITVGIIGAAGYTAGELIRLLIHHPGVSEILCQSSSQAGLPVHAVHADLVGETDMIFRETIDLQSTDVLFLCKGHGESVRFLKDNTVPDHLKIIDLSHDYRLKSQDNDFVYGLPELNRAVISSSQKIANPGCFATAIQLGLLPAASQNMIEGDIHTSGITGSTGAGQSLSRTSHFSWRNNNMSVYKPFTHQHLKEIGESLAQASGTSSFNISFIPYRGNFTRGIITTSYFRTQKSGEEVRQVYEDFYRDHPFTIVTDRNPDLKQVVNTNKALVYTEKHDEQVMVVTIIDNLLKGASGQAMQNMNLIFGLEETTGLRLKSIAF